MTRASEVSDALNAPKMELDEWDHIEDGNFT